MRWALAALAVVPFVPILPPAQQLHGVPTCAGSQLRASTTLQGATGSQLGGLSLRNTSSRACVLRAPLHIVRLAPNGRRLPLVAPVSSRGIGYTALRLDPGASAVEGLQLMNACDHAKSELWIVRPRVDLGIPPEGRCDSPAGPPAAYSGDLDRAGGSHPPHILRVVAVQAPGETARGRTLSYTVVVENPTARVWRGAPLYGEQLWLFHADRVVTRQYVLPLRTYAPHSRTTFAMRISVPARAERGALLEWSLIDSVEPIAPVLGANALLNSSIDLATYSWVHTAVTIR